MVDGAESRVPCGGNSVVGSVVCRLRQDTTGSQLVATGPCSGETLWSIKEFELEKTVSSASVSELATVEN